MEEKEMRQLGLPPEFREKREEEQRQRPKDRRKSTLRLRGHPGNYLPGVKRGEKIRWEMMNKLRIALAKIRGREITYQPELKGLEEAPVEKERNKSKGE